MNAPADPIQSFCDYYHEYNAITEQRRKMQTRVLREFEDHLPGDVLDVDAGQLRAYCAWLVSDEGLHPNTVRQYLNAIKPFINWLWQGRLISAENLLELRAVKPPRGASGMGKPNPYSRRELATFWTELEVAYPWCKEPWREDPSLERALFYLKRWKNGQSRWNRVQPYAKRLQVEAVIALALYGGLRRDEIYNLALDELHPDNEYIVVRSRKTRDGTPRVRGVPWLSVEMNDAVTHWIEFREMLAPAHDWPWLSLHYECHRLKPMRHRQFEMLMHDIGSGWEYHRMRHTAATIMLRTGIPLDKVSAIMGHSRLEQTRQYAKVDHTDVVLAARKATSHFSRAFARGDVAA